MALIAIDLSITKTGCIVFFDKDTFHAELILPPDFMSREMRSLYTVNRIEAIIKTFQNSPTPITECVVEGFSYMSKGGILVDLGIERGMLAKTLHENRISCEAISPKTVKKFATGNGSAEKEELINKLPKSVVKYFLKVLNTDSTSYIYFNDLADAYWLGLTYLGT